MAIKDDQNHYHAESNGQFVSKEEQDAKRQRAERIYNSDPPSNNKSPQKNK